MVLDPDKPAAATAPGRLLDRELSWLDFNERVLWLVSDRTLPLMERVKFAAIFASNLDEFFVVRVAGLERDLRSGRDRDRDSGIGVREVLRRIRSRSLDGELRIQTLLADELIPQLAQAGLAIRNFDDLTGRERQEAAEVFWHEVLPMLTPTPLAPDWSYPGIPNQAVGVAVHLRSRRTGEEAFSYVRVPRSARTRFVAVGERGRTLIPFESMIATHLRDIFPGHEPLGHTVIRVHRDADVEYSEGGGDLVRDVEAELRHRRQGPVIRLDTQGTATPEILRQLHSVFDTEDRHLYAMPDMIDVAGLWQVAGLPGFDDLRDPPIEPADHPAFTGPGSEPMGVPGDEVSDDEIFGVIGDREVVVHHPYHSYDSSVDRFVAAAVHDPAVMAIKHTVYRTSGDTSVVPALIAARNRERRAVCLVEIKARFDELANIHWGRELEHAGVEVAYGLPGLKTHMKAILVVRREADGVRRYAHIGTGNYHAGTARMYSDIGLFTADTDICADLADIFHWLTDHAPPPTPRKLLVAPGTLRPGIMAEIERCADAARNGTPARIAMKMNSLVDPDIIEALYAASQAGVAVDLNVRGICCLRPGVPGVSDNIRVVSIVGRVLEHARIYLFSAGDSRRVWVGSADMMPRNLNSRVEILAPVSDPRAIDGLTGLLDRYLRERTRAWELHPDGTWEKRAPRDPADPDSEDIHLELQRSGNGGLSTERVGPAAAG